MTLLKISKDKVEEVGSTITHANKLTTETFIEKAILKHGDKYNYQNTEYTGSKNKVTIECPIHGEFLVGASKHINDGIGCKQCGIARTVAASKLRTGPKITTEEFIKAAKEVHGDTYDYSLTEYIGCENKVTIVCKEHGEFQQDPYSHSKGVGCKKCADKNLSVIRSGEKSPGWSYTQWETAGKVSSNFEGYSLYVIECSSKSTGERFIKVGKTFQNITKRFAANSRMPYKYEVLVQVYHNAFAISTLETQIKRALKEHRYNPIKAFDGMTECLDIDAKEKALEMARE